MDPISDGTTIHFRGDHPDAFVTLAMIGGMIENEPAPFRVSGFWNKGQV